MWLHRENFLTSPVYHDNTDIRAYLSQDFQAHCNNWPSETWQRLRHGDYDRMYTGLSLTLTSHYPDISAGGIWGSDPLLLQRGLKGPAPGPQVLHPAKKEVNHIQRIQDGHSEGLYQSPLCHLLKPLNPLELSRRLLPVILRWDISFPAAGNISLIPPGS